MTYLAAGIYILIVGGYADACGPYWLTVREALPPIAEIPSAEATAGKNGNLIRWTSFAEVDLAYFSLFRVTGGERERVAVLRGHGSAADFGDYKFLDHAGSSASRYEIEAVGKDGRIEVKTVVS